MAKFTKLQHWLKATSKISTHTKTLLKKILAKESVQNAVGNPQYAIEAAYASKGAIAHVSPDAIHPTLSWRKMIGKGGLKNYYSLATEAYALVIGILTLFVWYLFKYTSRRRSRCDQGDRNY